MNFEKFQTFLCGHDLNADSANKVTYEHVKEGDLFEKYFSGLFNNSLYNIDNTAYIKELENSGCEVKKAIAISDSAFYDFIYTFKDSADGLFYIMMINRVAIDYCALKSFSEHDFMYAKRIVLKSFPCFLTLTAKEVDTLKTIFQKFSNLQGKVFYTRY